HTYIELYQGIQVKRVWLKQDRAKKAYQFRLSREPRALSCAASLEKAFSRCESRVVKMNGAICGRTVSSVPKQRRRRLVMSFEMVRLDRASSEPLSQPLSRQMRV